MTEIHSALREFFIETETVKLGAMFTQPHRPTFYTEQYDDVSTAYVDIGHLDEWGPTSEAEDLAGLLRAFDARLLIDENGVGRRLGLVVELTIKNDINHLVEEFMEQYNALFGL